MDILLTPEERHKVMDRYWGTGTYGEECCRAQLRKVVDAVQEWAVSADTEATVLKGDIWIPSDDIEWQALKAAGEGE